MKRRGNYVLEISCCCELNYEFKLIPAHCELMMMMMMMMMMMINLIKVSKY